MAALAAIKLVFVAAQPVRGIPSAGYDDALFVELTRTILNSNWLGDYTHLTLAKGPGAPLAFAAFHAIGLPLPVGQQLLYALACALVALAFRPLARRHLTVFAIFALLLLNPMTWDAQVMTRVSRSHVYTAAILAALAGWAGLAAWNARGRQATAAWAAVAGFATGFAWITREETIMVVPPLVLTAAGGALWIARDPERGTIAHYLGRTAAAVALAAGLVGTVALVNLANYGAFTVTEIRGGPFARAYGALSRVPPFDEAQQVVMTEEARRAAYRLSPAFRELEPSFEGELGDRWIAESKYFVGLPSTGRGLHRGWFIWALRDAAAAAGHHASADEAARYYERIATEINAACGDPALGCAPPRSSPLPPLDRERGARVARSWVDAATFVLALRHFGAWTEASLGNAAGLARFRETVRWPVASPVAPPREGARLALLDAAGRLYGRVSPYLTGLAFAAFVASLALAARRRRIELELVVAAAALALAAGCVTVVAMVDALAFPAVNMLYLAPAYPAIALFWAASLLALARLRAAR